jgi:hypothetical protein
MAILGILGASSLIIARKPDAQALIAKLAPWQGWIGAVSALWGAWGVITFVLHLSWLTSVPVFWASFGMVAVVMLALGLLLGVGVLKTFVRAPAATARLDQTITRLSPYQGTLGLISIGLGVWLVVAGFIWRVG